MLLDDDQRASQLKHPFHRLAYRKSSALNPYRLVVGLAARKLVHNLHAVDSQFVCRCADRMP
ncbi:hypothetical protein MCC93_03550 [Morococcus cerebrosus]|uniref:Uncharacterized protein n=1 Tax=Morococcus cerebrosus TaxID=1056807 RepID=A0A0C1H2Z4_9NEIS|nr:hypothetical protein MCC93_03550 [Morococcus cerebrosus]